MKIESVDFFYLSLPEVRDIGDGSQDALLVRVEANGQVGWGECEAAPLACLAAWNCPMSHSACKPVSASVLGQSLNGPEDIRRINSQVRAASFDLLQADHTLSGVDVALWDLVGKLREEPVYRLLGDQIAHPKIAYASQLFGDTPHDTFLAAREVAETGFRAAKFGWGPYGRQTVQLDAEQVQAARDGLGSDRILLIDAGTIWDDDSAAAAQRLPALRAAHVTWLEEPFANGALSAYRTLAQTSAPIKLAAGEGCHNFHQAVNLIDFGSVGYIQIDAGRIGGITTARQIAEYARRKNVQFVNHTFTTSLALSASLQPFAGTESDQLCEYPTKPSALARELTTRQIQPDSEGCIRVPTEPGLGIVPDLKAIQKYLLPVEIHVRGRIWSYPRGQ